MGRARIWPFEAQSLKDYRCGRCRECKPEDEFPPNSDPCTRENRPVAYICRECAKEYRLLRKARLAEGTWAGAPRWRKPLAPHGGYKRLGETTEWVDRRAADRLRLREILKTTDGG